MRRAMWVQNWCVPCERCAANLLSHHDWYPQDDFVIPEGMSSESELLQRGFQELGITTEPTDANVAKIRSAASRFSNEFMGDQVDFARIVFKLHPEGSNERFVKMRFYAHVLQQRFEETEDPDDLAEIIGLEQKLGSRQPVSGGGMSSSVEKLSSLFTQLQRYGSAPRTLPSSVATVSIVSSHQDPNLAQSLRSSVRPRLRYQTC